MSISTQDETNDLFRAARHLENALNSEGGYFRTESPREELKDTLDRYKKAIRRASDLVGPFTASAELFGVFGSLETLLRECPGAFYFEGQVKYHEAYNRLDENLNGELPDLPPDSPFPIPKHRSILLESITALRAAGFRLDAEGNARVLETVPAPVGGTNGAANWNHTVRTLEQLDSLGQIIVRALIDFGARDRDTGKPMRELLPKVQLKYRTTDKTILNRINAMPDIVERGGGRFWISENFLNIFQ